MDHEDVRWVAVHATSGMVDATIVAGRLETEGIPTRLEYEAAGVIYAVTVDGLGEVRVMVPHEHLEKAREILSRSYENEELPWDGRR
jgi:hypothetical protein